MAMGMAMSSTVLGCASLLFLHSTSYTNGTYACDTLAAGGMEVFMRISMRAISLAISASLALVLSLLLLSGISVPAFASGDDKSPAATSASSKNAAPVPDREK